MCLLRGFRRRHNAKLLQLSDKVPQLLGLRIVEFAQIDVNLSQQVRHLSAVVVLVSGCGDIGLYHLVPEASADEIDAPLTQHSRCVF